MGTALGANARAFVCWAAVVLAIMGNSPTQAQMPDTTDVVGDSLAQIAPPVGFRGVEPGWVLGDTMLAVSPEIDATGVLADVPGSFLYDFGTVGWPHGWSPYGLNPQRVALVLNGLPLDDPVTGRPRYDLLPFSFLEPLGYQAGRYGTSVGVYADVRPFNNPRPLTELRYHTGSNGFQSITGMHVQRRRGKLFGNEGIWNILFGYGGHAAKGEYAGSRLERMRQLLGRLRYEQVNWSVELNNWYNRRRIGAHGGVLPQAGGSPESIYNRFGASVRNAEAKRQTSRNDLSLTLRSRVFGSQSLPLTLSTFWTAQTFRYNHPGSDTLVTKTNRIGGRVHQDALLGRHAVRLLVEGWVDAVRTSNALPDSLDLTRYQVHATLRDSLRLGAWDVRFEGGLHANERSVFAGGSLYLGWHWRSALLFAEAMHTGQPSSLVEEYGFGRFILPVEQVPNGRLSQGKVGFRVQGGSFDVSAFGYAQVMAEPLDLYTIGEEDSLAAWVAAEGFQQAGVGADIGWRRTAERGFYMTAQPSLFQFLNENASSVHKRMAATLPSFSVRGSLGARYLLFNELDLDLSASARYWTAFRSRHFHGPTGLLVVPTLNDASYEPSWTLDLIAHAGIRGATLFVAWENILSGTPLLVGNLIVPVYPLPAQRFRFGVFWPILN